MQERKMHLNGIRYSDGRKVCEFIFDEIHEPNWIGRKLGKPLIITETCIETNNYGKTWHDYGNSGFAISERNQPNVLRLLRELYQWMPTSPAKELLELPS